jgi:hypothetical protein
MIVGGKINKVPLDNSLEIYTVTEQHYDLNIGLTDEEGKLTPSIA